MIIMLERTVQCFETGKNNEIIDESCDKTLKLRKKIIFMI